ncbi:MAG TPA: peptidylprolyl isomerase [Thermodesulfobacteriota bacterium]|nr:peptidylprolyl isomerase [Thermodesulfobacteriota bacterium]
MRYMVVFTAIALLAGCSDFNNFYESGRERRGEKGAGPGVVAVVGRDEITMEDLSRALERMPFKKRKLYQSSPQNMSEFLDIYINQKVLYTEAVRRGIDERQDVIEKTENFKKQLIGQTFGQEILKDLEVSDVEIEDYFRRHREDYEQLGISEILIKTDPASGITKEEALARAWEVSERAKAGEEWKDLAMRYSGDGASKKKAGETVYIQRGSFGPGIDDELFRMKKGEITNPLEVDGGYFIIKINEGAAPLPDGQVRRKIESILVNEKLVEYVYGLREESGVEVYRDRLEESMKSE